MTPTDESEPPQRRPGRRKPYTKVGITRLACSVTGCCNRGYSTWQACADEGKHRPICLYHDIALNMMVLEWMGDPEARAKVLKYAKARGVESLIFSRHDMAQ